MAKKKKLLRAGEKAAKQAEEQAHEPENQRRRPVNPSPQWVPPREWLAALAQRIPAWREGGARDPEIRPLPGGITNRNFRVDVGGKAYVLRLFGAGTELLGIVREHELTCAGIAAGLGVGPEVVFGDPAGEVLVTRFLEGNLLTAQEAARPEALRRMAEALRAVHGGPEFPGRFSPFQAARAFHHHAIERGGTLPERLGNCFKIMERLEAALEAIPRGTQEATQEVTQRAPPEGGPALRPCHNDLLGENLLDDGRAIRFLDWEYAAMGDPYFDLGFFAINLELDDAACGLLLESYCGESGAARLARLRLMGVASLLRDGFWGLLQARISEIDYDFAAYGIGQLERFLELTARPKFQHLLTVL